MKGKVILVGAGPGDGGLITVKGLEALKSADVVVYDRLVGQEILDMIPESAGKIDVGKASSNHKVPQEEINRILLNKALEGKNVVRLKGGDPFVFGRGGEELELLAEHGVDFSVIPGVTSAVAAPAYGGIPVTHRDHASSLHIVTGHARAGKELDVDFRALVRVGGTLVFLMGVASLPAIVKGLLEAGMDENTPAAMVENGTRPDQRRCDATLATLENAAAEMEIGSPAVIIVGGVCALAEKFCWMDRLPLRGKTVVVTRPRERAGTLSNKLRALGADVLEYPCIRTVPITPNHKLRSAIESMERYEWLCFTSPAGVNCFWRQLDAMGLDARALGGVKVAVIGSGTARTLVEKGVKADLVPEVFDAEHLGATLAARAKGRILIPRAEEGSPELTARLTDYDEIPVYRTVYENPNAGELKQRLASAGTMYVTFTSASTVRGFVNSLGGVIPQNVLGLCIGKQTAAEAEKYGIAVKTANTATIDSLVALTEKILRGV